LTKYDQHRSLLGHNIGMEVYNQKQRSWYWRNGIPWILILKKWSSLNTSIEEIWYLMVNIIGKDDQNVEMEFNMVKG
jgi:hypothetical protein